ncbi:MAG: membrane protein insertion efficiency factor YidD [Candidatus Woykebacteria bacterium]
MKKTLIWAIKKYQALISPLLGVQCIYYPTCSQYTIETLEEQPVFIALPKILTRILSCNPINAYIKRRSA